MMRRWKDGMIPASAFDREATEARARGENEHGEADFVESLGARSVLDAGCGTGRVAIELARRAVEVVGVDRDPTLLSAARARAPQLEWHLADLAKVDLGRRFELVLLAGHVMIFLDEDTEAAVVACLAAHLVPGGQLVAGFGTRSHLSAAAYDAMATACGLSLKARWATWDRQPWRPESEFALFVHRAPGESAV